MKIEKIGLFSATMVVMGTIIGSGVFKKAAPMTELLGSELLVHLCWILAGIITLLGALTYAELGSRVPDSGGLYSYLRVAYGSQFAFLFGWGCITVIQSGSIASMAYVFAESVQRLIGFNSDFTAKIIAAISILFLTGVNYRGIGFGALVQNLFTVGKILGVILVIGVGLYFFKVPFNVDVAQEHLNENLPKMTIGILFSGLLSAFWAYDGINNIGFIGEEIKNPEVNIPRSLIGGVLLVIVFYLVIHFAYFRIQTIPEIQAIAKLDSTVFAIESIRSILGSVGALIITFFVAVSTFGCANGSILASSRIYSTMARDGLFFKSWAVLHPKFHSPHRALVGQGIWASALVFTGSFDELTDRLIFASFIFYGVGAFGLFKLRREKFGKPTYVVPSWLAWFYIAFCIILVSVVLVTQTKQALSGVALIVLGIPIYYFWKRK